ncbi:DUF6193 family natural product biosynthesis protein [Plantactinospora sp. B5E13]|uniref:DUF6193 family natural product biosynthesis protein n=1 Tax=Plantactinospora sp. B5E13 TaxID=3153758 RepID=UPI00325F430A
MGARVEDNQWCTNVLMARLERSFSVNFWARGVLMARGSTGDLSEVAGAAATWRSGVRVRDLGAAWAYVRFGPLAEAHERGEAAEFTWRRYAENAHQAPQLTRLASFVNLAIQEPRMRALMPFTSHWRLGFSRTVGYPYSGDCPWVIPLDDGRYQVRAADGREWGIGDATASLNLVLAALDDPTPS